MKSIQLSSSANSTTRRSSAHSPLKRAPLRGRKTDPGVAGKANQDSYALFAVGPKRGSNWEADPERTLYVVAVADGVTGQAAGANASEVAVHTLQQVMSQRAHHLPPAQCLREAFEAANAKILQVAREDSKLRGMSTTLVAAVIDGWRLHLGHVGDSRAYLIRDKAIYRLTLDHTWVQEALDAERLTDSEARTHTNRHNLLRYLGNPRGLDVDQTIITPGTDTGPQRRFEMELALQPNDVILLCSDGVTDKLNQQEILNVVRRHRRQPRMAARALVDVAVERREEDNITAVLLSLPGRRWPMGLLALGGLLILLAALATFLPWPRVLFPPGGLVSAGQLERGVVETQPGVGDAGDGSPGDANAGSANAGSANAGNTAVDEPSANDVGMIDAIGSMNVISQVTALLSNSGETEAPALGAASPAAQEALSARPTSTRVATRVAVVPTPLAPTATETARPAAATTPRQVAASPASTAAISPTTSSPTTSLGEPAPALERSEAEEPDAQNQADAPSESVDAISEADAVQDWVVQLRNPLESNLSGQHVFLWEPNFTLPERYVYELIFWRVGDNALDRGFSPVGAGGGASVVVDLTETARSLPQLQLGRDYFWSVLLVDAENTQHRIKLLGEPQLFRVSTSGQSPNDRAEPEKPGGADEPPADEPPADEPPEEEPPEEEPR